MEGGEIVCQLGGNTTNHYHRRVLSEKKPMVNTNSEDDSDTITNLRATELMTKREREKINTLAKVH